MIRRSLRSRHASAAPRAARGGRGFALVQLLVVIAVVAALLALLLPALGAARYQAKLTRCQSRLHQFGAGLATYTVDANGRDPDREPYVHGPASPGTNPHTLKTEDTTPSADDRPAWKRYLGSANHVQCPFLRHR